MKTVVPASMLVLLSGCVAVGGDLPRTLGERSANYGYVPLDPLPIETVTTATSCHGGEKDYKPLPEALPDISVRYAVAQISAGGQAAFGPAQVTTKNSAYRAVLDYINSDSVTLNFLVRKQVKADGSAWEQWKPVSYEVDTAKNEHVTAYEARLVPEQHGAKLEGAASIASLNFDERGERLPRPSPESGATKSEPEQGWERVAVPIYIGLGLRLTVEITALQGGVELSGLTAIGAKADANKLTGFLTLQSLGINGLPMTTTLTIPSKLNQDTAEAAILALGSGRVAIYADSASGKVTLNPRVVGLYSPVGSDPRLINAIYSELSTIRVPWPRPCVWEKKSGN